MKTILLIAALLGGFSVAKSNIPTVVAPVTAPKNATAQCKDKTYHYKKVRRGACSRHGGVMNWYKGRI